MTLKIGSTEVTLAPDQTYTYQPQGNKPVKLVAKPQVAKIFQNAERTLTKPLIPEDHVIEILSAHGADGKYSLMFRVAR